MRILYSLILLCGTLAITPAIAQSSKENGKTYYEGTDKVKEVFHFREVYKVSQNPNNPEEFKDTMIIVKHGDYISYNETGKLVNSGFYVDNKKDGTWLFYDEAGKVIKTEMYERGKLVSKPSK